MKKLKSHTRNQRRMYRIHKQEEKIHDLELLVGSLQHENQKYKEVIDKLNNLNNRIIEEYKLNYGDNPSKLLLALNTISDILKEVE